MNASDHKKVMAQFSRLVQLQEVSAAHDPKFMQGFCDATIKAVTTRDVEVSIWFDHIGEMTLARDSLQRFFSQAKAVAQHGVTGLEWKLDREAVTMTLELSNGSAIRLGLKALEKLSKKDLSDPDRIVEV